MTKDQIESLLSSYSLPYLNKNPIELQAIRQLIVDEKNLELSLQLSIPVGGIKQQIQEEITALLTEKTNLENITVDIQSKIVSRSVQRGVATLSGVKNIIAVASGKGGVGKSTVSVNLALALQTQGATVGLMDADIYGPSQPMMLNCHGRPQTIDGKTMEPLENHGLQCISIGHLLDADDSPVVWRGPMAVSALQQLIKETNWKDLDYLIIDLPPGTGDIQLTLSQQIPLTGAVIVTTPQDISLLDAKKALKMFEKVAVPILGVVENMSTHICSQCGHEEHIFGQGGGVQMAETYQIPLLGQLPLNAGIREDVDNGTPTVISSPENKISGTFKEIAMRVSATVALQNKDFSSKIPKIVIENT